MSAATKPKTSKPEVRGACPGALRPMESGDGLIVRIRPRAGVLDMDQIEAITAAARRYGNGEIDLTSRANLQLRGVRAETLSELQLVFSEHNLLDASPEAEAIRNIIVSPFVPYLVGEERGARNVARELESLLAEDKRLWQLSPKFGFVIDDFQAALDGVPGDLVLSDLGSRVYALGAAGPDGVRWLGKVEEWNAALVLTRAAHAYLATQPAGSRLRLRDAGPDVLAAITADIEIEPLREPPERCATKARLGCEQAMVGVGVPFGRISATTLADLCEDADLLGASRGWNAC